MARHNELGHWGEDIACETLITRGCAIVERNWRLGRYEIDIIAMKDDFIIFVEVKTRSDKDADPLQAIDRRKISFIAASAQAYMQHSGEHRQARFDVFGISGTPDDYSVEYIPDAFWPSLRSYR